MKVEINDRLYKDIKGYCELNNIDIAEFINKVLKSGYMLEKYGDRPGIQGKPIEVEETKEMDIPIETESKPKLQVKWNIDFEHDEGLKQAREIEKEVIEQHNKQAETPKQEEPKKERRRKLS